MRYQPTNIHLPKASRDATLPQEQLVVTQLCAALSDATEKYKEESTYRYSNLLEELNSIQNRARKFQDKYEQEPENYGKNDYKEDIEDLQYRASTEIPKRLKELQVYQGRLHKKFRILALYNTIDKKLRDLVAKINDLQSEQQPNLELVDALFVLCGNLKRIKVECIKTKGSISENIKNLQIIAVEIKKELQEDYQKLEEPTLKNSYNRAQ